MRGRRQGEDGYTLVVLLAAVTVMLIMMAAAVPSWRYVMKNDAEEELIFRGGEIADAIARFQAKNGNALPPNLEILVKGKFLRREYKDPMTEHGRWRFIRPGESVGAIRPPGAGGSGGGLRTPTTTTTTTRPSAFTRTPGRGGTLGGGIQGVASTSTDEGLRVFNGRTKYNEWLFLPGQPRVIGRPRTPGVQGGVPGQPGTAPGRPGQPGQPVQPAPLTGPGIRR